MSNLENKSLSQHFRDIPGIRSNWGWFFLLGLLLILLGGFLISSGFYGTLLSVMFFGALLVGAGLVQIVQAFLARRWSGLLLSLLLGVLYIVTGFLCISSPGLTALNLTLFIAGFCFVIGLFRMISSLMLHFEQWGWVFFNGLITFILGILIYSQWPVSGLWVIGLFVGIDMILSGWTWILLSFSARQANNPRIENDIRR